MNVNKVYYYNGEFDRPEKVVSIVHWANSFMLKHKHTSPAYIVAKRIKNLCIKHYRFERGSDIRFDEEWEDNPILMLNWILDRYPSGNCRLVRFDKKGNFSPYNLDLRPRLD